MEVRIGYGGKNIRIALNAVGMRHLRSEWDKTRRKKVTNEWVLKEFAKIKTE